VPDKQSPARAPHVCLRLVPGCGPRSRSSTTGREQRQRASISVRRPAASDELAVRRTLFEVGLVARRCFSSEAQIVPLLSHLDVRHQVRPRSACPGEGQERDGQRGSQRQVDAGSCRPYGPRARRRRRRKPQPAMNARMKQAATTLRPASVHNHLGSSGGRGSVIFLGGGLPVAHLRCGLPRNG